MHVCLQRVSGNKALKALRLLVRASVEEAGAAVQEEGEEGGLLAGSTVEILEIDPGRLGPGEGRIQDPFCGARWQRGGEWGYAARTPAEQAYMRSRLLLVIWGLSITSSARCNWLALLLAEAFLSCMVQ